MRAVIAGAGTSGLVASLLLRRLGWDVIVLETHARPRTGTRAPTIWPPALHAFEVAGVADQVAAEANPVTALKFQDETLSRTLDLGDSHCVTLSQSRLEELLEERARATGVGIRRRTALTDARVQDDGQIQVTAVSTTGSTTIHTADLLVGADGHRSVTRQLIDAQLRGPCHPTDFELVDFVDHTGAFDRRSVWTCTGALGPLVIVPLPNDTIRLVAPRPASTGSPSRQFLRDRTIGYGFAPPDGEVVWEAVFTARSQQATRFAKGPIAIIGDAAHVQSPAGGRGMNQGIEDAFTLVSEIAASEHQDLALALARFAATREREMADELSVNVSVTSRWTGKDAPEPRESTVRTEMEIATCSFRRATAPRALDAGASPLLGRRVRLDARGWPVPTALHIHDGCILGGDWPGAAGAAPTLVGDSRPLPDGVYALSPTMNILAVRSGKETP